MHDTGLMGPMQDTGFMGPMQRLGALGTIWGGVLETLGPIWSGASALEAEGRLNGPLGAKPPGIRSLLALLSDACWPY